MPIKQELRGFYPIDWRELSRSIRFRRAKGSCEHCGRPHGQLVCVLAAGRWFDAERQAWRDGKGRRFGPICRHRRTYQQPLGIGGRSSASPART